HPGNYLVSYHPRLGILDFGSIRRFPENVRKSHLLLGRGIVDCDDRVIGAAMQKLGWLDRAQDPAPMVRIIRIMFEPMIVDLEYAPCDYDRVAKAAKVGEIGLANRLYKSPAHSVFLLRALIGLEGIIRRLGIRASYRRIFRDCVERAERAEP